MLVTMLSSTSISTNGKLFGIEIFSGIIAHPAGRIVIELS